MEAMRHAWTDERLDDLNNRVEAGFRRVDADFHALNARFDSLQRNLLQLGGVMIAALMGIIAVLIGTQL